MTRAKALITLTACVSTLLVTSTASAAPPYREATLYYVDDHDGANACGGSDFSWATDTVGYLEDKLDLWGFDETYYHGNTFVDSQDLADVNEDATGWDHAGPHGIDSADIGMVYSHGGYSCANDHHSYIKMGDANGAECNLHYSSAASFNDAWWGDSDLNAMIVDTCSSAQWCVWNNGGYYAVSGNFAALLGFHGISSDRSSHTNNFENFTDNSRYNGLGDNWVDDLTRRPIGADNDECAVAIIYADNDSDADYIFDYMGLQDWKTPGSHTVSYYYYIENCNPDDGQQL
jgi:hypothetical protein